MVRRVVTHIKNGRSSIMEDTLVKNIEVPLPDIDSDLKFFNIWMTNTTPVYLCDDGDPVAKGIHVSTSPVENGSLFRVVNYPPEGKLLNLVRSMSENQLKSFEERTGVNLIMEDKHPFMHMTYSIDFGIVLSGEIYLMLDEEETLLKAGDVVVQRGTNHAWSNRSEFDCKMAYVLLDGTF